MVITGTPSLLARQSLSVTLDRTMRPQIRPARLRILSLTASAAIAASLLPFGCQRKSASEPPAPDVPPSETSSSPPVGGTDTGNVRSSPGAAKTAAPAEIWKLFSGEKAFEEVRKQVELGPRPAGSTELEKARVLITEGLQRHGWDVQRQEFTDDTPRGPVKFCNLIGRFSAGKKRPAPANIQRAIVCSHFDTKRYSTIKFLGANDAGSSTGALIELARVLALDPRLAEQIELVFFDGEEAFSQFTETDGLYGSRHYALDLRKSGRAPQFKFGILWDMIGEKDLTITLSPDSPKELARGILATAESLALRNHFSFFSSAIWDDHVPLNRVKIPTINLIDFDFLYWHTADDTLDKLAPESLQKIGAITLKYLHEQLPR